MEPQRKYAGSRRLSPAARRVVTAALVAATIGAPSVALAAAPTSAMSQETVTNSENRAPETSGIDIGATDSDALSWKIEGSTLTISGTGNMKDFTRNYTINSEWGENGKTDYKTAAPWAAVDDSITKVVVENGVTSLGAYAFSGLEKAESIELPDSLISIGSSALTEMTSLNSLLIPSKVSSIGSGALTSLKSLSSIYVANENVTYGAKDGVLYKYGTNGEYKELVAYPFGKNDSEFVVPESVDTLSDGAFVGTRASRVDISKSKVASIPDHCFSWSSVTYVPGIEKVTSISKMAFLNSSIRSVSFGSCRTIGEQAFANCKNLVNVSLVGVEEVGPRAFIESGLTSLTIPNSIKKIGSSAFNNCENLKTVEIEASNLDGETSGWFASSKNLQSVKFTGTGSAVFGSYAFSGCSSLRVVDLTKAASVKLGYSSLVGTTGSCAVYTKDSVSNKTHPAGDGYKVAWVVTNGAPVGEIPADGSLPAVTTPSGYEFDGWFDSKGNKVEAPVSGAEVRARFYTTSAKDGGITWSLSGDTLTISKNADAGDAGVMKDYDASSYAGAPWSVFAHKVTRLVVEDGVTHVGNYAFKNMSSLRDVEIKGKLTSTVSDRSFSGCVLNSVTFSGDDFYVPQAFFAEIKSLGYIDCRSFTGNSIGFGGAQSHNYWSAPSKTLVLLPSAVKTITNSSSATPYLVVVDKSVSVDLSESGLSALYADGKSLSWYTDANHMNKVDDPAGAQPNKKAYYGVLKDSAVTVGEVTDGGLAYGYESGAVAARLGVAQGGTYESASVLSGDIASCEVAADGSNVIFKAVDGLGSGEHAAVVRIVTNDGASHVVNVKYKVGKAKTSIEKPENANVTYDGKAHAVSAKVKSGDIEVADATVAYYAKGENGTKGAKLDGAPVNAGSYIAVLSYAGDANYEAAKGTEVGITIAKAAMQVEIVVTPDKLVGGGRVEIVVDKVPEGAKVTVECDDTSVKVEKAADGKFSATLPNANKTYGFTAMTAETGNYEAGMSSKATVKVTRKSTGGGGGTVVPTPTKYKVDVADAENGTVKADKATAAKGDKVTLTAAAAEGYRTSAVTVTDASGEAVSLTLNADGTYSFEMPASDVRVAASFARREAKAFPDVDQSAWYAKGVAFVSSRGIMGGYPDGTFGVGRTLTRAEFAQLLYKRAGGVDDGAAENETGMADVAGSEWYTAAANWAVKNGVINGYGNADGTRTFGPNDPVTLEQMVAIIANLERVDVAKADASVLGRFVDPGDVSPWFTRSVAWAVQAGLVNGSSEADGLHIRPAEPIMRERVASVIMNAYDKGVLK